MIFGFYCFPLFSLPLPRFLSFIFILFFFYSSLKLFIIYSLLGGKNRFKNSKTIKTNATKNFKLVFLAQLIQFLGFVKLNHRENLILIRKNKSRGKERSGKNKNRGKQHQP